MGRILGEKELNILKQKSAYSLPDNPSDKGLSASQIKAKLWEPNLLIFKWIEELYVDNDSIHKIIDTIPDKVDKSTEKNIVYGTDKEGNQRKIPYNVLVNKNTLVLRDDNGLFEIKEPVNDYHPTTKQYVENELKSKLNISVELTSYPQVYSKSANGEGLMFDVSSSSISNSLVSRDDNGLFEIKEPVNDYHPTTKQYVDKEIEELKDKLFEVIATTLEEDITSDAYVVPSAIDSHPIIEGVPFELKGVSGNSRVFNQLVKTNIAEGTTNGITITKDENGNLILNGTCTSTSNYYATVVNREGFANDKLIAGHKYLKTTRQNQLGSYFTGITNSSPSLFNTFDIIFTFEGINANQLSFVLVIPPNAVCNNLKIIPQLYDLTSMFGEGNEPTTIDEFNALYPLEYYEYNESEIKSTTLSKIESREQYVSVDLGTLNYSYDSTTKRFVPNPYTQLPNMKIVKDYSTIPNFICSLYKPTTINDFDNNITDMSIRGHTSLNGWFAIRNTNYTDATEFKNAMSGVILKYQSINPNDAPLIKTINLPNGKITLNGINEIKDTLTFEEQEDGTYNAILTRRIGVIDLGTLNWIKYSTSNDFNVFYINNIKSFLIKPTTNSYKNYSQLLDSKGYYLIRKTLADQIVNTPEDKCISIDINGVLYITDNAYTNATDFKNAMSGVMLYYELAEPTTETIATGLSFEDISSLFEIGGTIVNDNENTNYNIQATTTIDIVCKDWSI